MRRTAPPPAKSRTRTVGRGMIEMKKEGVLENLKEEKGWTPDRQQASKTGGEIGGDDPGIVDQLLDVTEVKRELKKKILRKQQERIREK